MTDAEIRILDAAYKPFPTVEEWASRTSVDTVRWERYNSSLNRDAGLSTAVLSRAQQIAKRAGAFDTGAIEDAAWETGLATKGEHVRPLFEAQLHAYDYVLDLATKAEPISEAAIRALHEEVCRAQTTYHVVTAVGPKNSPSPKDNTKYCQTSQNQKGR